MIKDARPRVARRKPCPGGQEGVGRDVSLPRRWSSLRTRHQRCKPWTEASRNRGSAQHLTQRNRREATATVKSGEAHGPGRLTRDCAAQGPSSDGNAVYTVSKLRSEPNCLQGAMPDSSVDAIENLCTVNLHPARKSGWNTQLGSTPASGVFRRYLAFEFHREAVMRLASTS